jgi:RHS repeat-associated protein
MTAGYNGAHELTSYNNAAGDMTTASYDGNGLRQSDTSTPAGGSATTENFTWDTTNSVPELLMDSNNAYIYAGGGSPVEQVALSDGTINYLASDLLGSIRGVVNGSSGALTASTPYDAWGNPETTGGFAANTPFGYAGGYTDTTGLSYLINRYYDPQSGQFVTIDPLVGETNASYTYGGDDPTNVVDPTGLCLANPGNAQGSTKCQEIWQDIVRKTTGNNGAFARYWEMLNKAVGAPGKGHVKAFNHMKDGLKKSLQEFSRNKCEPPDENYLKFAWWISEKDAPTRQEVEAYQQARDKAGGGEAHIDIRTLPPTITFEGGGAPIIMVELG